MVMTVIMGWMKFVVILTGFFSFAGKDQVKSTWKYRCLTMFVMALYLSIRAFPFEKPSIRHVAEVSLLFCYIIIYCQKEFGRHFMYLILVYVIVDVMSVLIGVISYLLQGCSPGEDYLVWLDGSIIATYVILFFLFPILQKVLRPLIGSQGFTLAEAGMTFILIFAKCIVLAFTGSENEGIARAYFSSFPFALAIGALWMINKKAEEKRVREFVKYEHRMREVLPSVGKVLEKMGEMPDNSEEAAKAIAELQAVCRFDEKTTRTEVLAAQTFCSTGNSLLDGMLERYLQEAAQKGRKLDVIVRAPVDAVLKEQEMEIGLLLQMLGDIYRNADKAVSKRGDKGRILLCMGYNQEAEYEISVSDNGEPFLRHVLEHLGERGVTTGGTGYGLADVFEVAEKYKVSFLLEQNLSQNHMFSKTIHLIFDGKNRRSVSERKGRIIFSSAENGIS